MKIRAGCFFFLPRAAGHLSRGCFPQPELAGSQKIERSVIEILSFEAPRRLKPWPASRTRRLPRAHFKPSWRSSGARWISIHFIAPFLLRLSAGRSRPAVSASATLARLVLTEAQACGHGHTAGRRALRILEPLRSALSASLSRALPAPR
jgi:hypothetical protein